MAWTVDDPIKRESDFNVMCAVAHFVGVILVLAAIGLWFVPGAFGDAQTAMMRFAVSLLFGASGLVLLSKRKVSTRSEIEIDPIRSELRHYHRGADGVSRLVGRHAMSDVNVTWMTSRNARIWGADGALLMDVALETEADAADVVSALRYVA